MSLPVTIDASLIEAQLARAQSNVRTLDDKFRQLAGRVGPPSTHPGANVSLDPSYADEDALGDYGKRFRQHDVAEQNQTSTSLPSAVIMPTIDTKSRTEAIKEQSGALPAEQQKRNRRMFASLLGTLSDFSRQRKSVDSALTVQEQKQARVQSEIEARLENEKRKEQDKLKQEREKILAEKRQQIGEITLLQKKRNLIQFAERDEKNLRLQANFIRTSAKPHLYYMPVKHTLRTLELHKKTEAMIADRISERQATLERELQALEESSRNRQQRQLHQREQDHHEMNRDPVHYTGSGSASGVGAQGRHMAHAGDRRNRHRDAPVEGAELVHRGREPRRRSRSSSRGATPISDGELDAEPAGGQRDGRDAPSEGHHEEELQLPQDDSVHIEAGERDGEETAEQNGDDSKE